MALRLADHEAEQIFLFQNLKGEFNWEAFLFAVKHFLPDKTGAWSDLSASL